MKKKRAPPAGAPGGKGGFRGSPPENLKKKTRSLCKEGGFRGSPPKKKKKSVDLGADLGEKGGFRGSPPENMNKNLRRAIYVFGSVFRGVFGSKLEFAPRDLQAFHYWQVPRPSTYYFTTCTYIIIPLTCTCEYYRQLLPSNPLSILDKHLPLPLRPIHTPPPLPLPLSPPPPQFPLRQHSFQP